MYWVEVGFDSFYTSKNYAYKYDLKQKPQIGDIYVVKTSRKFCLVECKVVHAGSPPPVATKYILGKFETRGWEKLNKRKNEGHGSAR